MNRLNKLNMVVLLLTVFVADAGYCPAEKSGISDALVRSRRLVGRLIPEKSMPLPGGNGSGGVNLSLDQCLALALSNNIDIRLALFPGKKLRQDVEQARAAFDAVLSAALSGSTSERPATNPLAGRASINNDSMDFNVAVSRRTLDGTDLSISYASAMSKTDSAFVVLDPAHTSALSLELRRSLTRWRGKKLNLAALRRVKHEEAAARCALHAVINATMHSVVLAFLDLIQKEENLVIQENSYRQVEELVDITRKRMAVGRAVRAQLVKDQAQLAAQREEVIVAKAAREQSCDFLLQLIFPDPSTRPDPDRLRVDLDLPEKLETRVDLDELSERARLCRPEVLELMCRLDAQDLSILLAEDETRPSLDLVGNVTFSGLDDNYSGAVNDLTGLDFPTYTLGFQYSVPFGRRAERSRLKKARLEKEELKLRLLDLTSKIELEVRQAKRDMRTAVERVKAARMTVDFASSSYTDEKLLYSQGRTTAYQVNEYRIQLDEARLRLLRARLDYFASLSALRKAEGSLADIFAELGTVNASTLGKGIAIRPRSK